MIKIVCKKPDYEYDVHSLVKAFYPAEELDFVRESESDAEETECKESPEVPET